MIAMGVEGIEWVGGVYLKFESMCLEVEENMYQDTLKFVENQVETVGATVKKFYADVMQDLLDQSSTDPEKMSTSVLPVEHNIDVNSSKYTKISKKEEPVMVGVEQLIGDSEMMDVKNKEVDHESTVHGQQEYAYCMPSSGNCREGAYSDLYSRQEFSGSFLSNTRSVVKENSIKDRLTWAINPAEKGLSRQSSLGHKILNDTHEALSEHTDTVITPSIDVGITCDSTRESCVIANARLCTSDVAIDLQSYQMVVSNKSDGKEWKEILHSSAGGLSAESNDTENCLSNSVVSLVGPSPSGQVVYERYADHEVSASYPGVSHDSSLGANEGNIVTVDGKENLQQSDKEKLEEACVIVTGEDTHFVPHMEGKPGPYKKSFTSRMRSASKQEYEQLAVWYGDDAKSKSDSGEGLVLSLTMEETKKSPVDDYFESEWEIL